MTKLSVSEQFYLSVNKQQNKAIHRYADYQETETFKWTLITFVGSFLPLSTYTLDTNESNFHQKDIIQLYETQMTHIRHTVGGGWSIRDERDVINTSSSK